MNLEHIPVMIKVWIDCPRCGPRPKFQDAVTLNHLDATPLLLKSPYACERCGCPQAFLVLERQPHSIH
jgi:hypothetical protein